MRPTVAMLLALCGLMLPAAAVRAELTDPAMLMPADATVFVTIDLPALSERGQRTRLWQLTQDPAMQPFMASLRKACGEAIDEAMKEFVSQTGVSLPETMPWPQGRAAAAMKFNLVEVTYEVPAYLSRPAGGMYGSGDDFGFDADLQFDAGEDDGGGETHTYTGTVPNVEAVLVVDFGAAMDTFRPFAQRVVDAAVDAGDVERSRESYRDVELTLLTFPEDGPMQGEIFAYAFQGSMLVVGSEPDMVRHVLGRMDGAPAPSLGDSAAFRDMVRDLGDAQIVACADLQRLIADLTELPRSEDPEVGKILRATGADGLRYAGAAVDVAPDPVVQVRYRLRVAVEGRKRGIVAMFAPQTRPLRVPPFTLAPLNTLIVANFEPGEIFDQVNTLASALGGAPVGMFAQQMMAETGSAGRPPVSLRNDVLGRLHAPMALRVSLENRGGGEPAVQVLFSLATSETAGLNEAISRIHGTFLPDPESRRDLLGSTLYLLEPDDEEVPALTTAGDTFLAGTLPALQAAVMSLRGQEGRPLETDPLFVHTRRFLPGEAGAWLYVDHQVDIGAVWDAVRRDTDSEILEYSALGEMIDALGDVDVTLLPPFERVKPYFGAGAFHLVSTDDGFRGEGVLVAPPAAQE
ncbi:MAG: hypothetical protein GX591_10060 [Planctomycetes bacterium]|nr:hypothetical protein [Planctomycetota bacterium]